MSDYVLSAVLEMKDRLTPRLKSAAQGLKGLSADTSAASAALSKTESAASSAAASYAKVESAAKRAGSAVKELSGAPKMVRVGVQDEATGKLTRIKGELAGLAGKVYEAHVRISSNMEAVRGKLGGTLGSAASGFLANTSMQMAGAAGIGFGVYDAIKSYSDFEAQLSSVQAQAGATDEELVKIRARAKELGAISVFNNTDSAKAMEELVKAGLELDQVLGTASKDALDLAAAGKIDLPEAAEILSNAMLAFGETDSTAAANSLNGAAMASTTSVHELGYSLAAVGPVAKLAGMTLDDTDTALALLAKNALKGSDAGTSLKSMLQSLVPATNPAYEAFKRFNLLTEEGTSLFYDEKGQLKSIGEIAGLLQDRFGDLSNEEMMDAFRTLFGSDGIRAAAALVKEGEQGVKDMQAAMRKTTVAEIAEKNTQNLKGALEEASGAWENFTHTLLSSSGAGSGLEGAVRKLADYIKEFEKLARDGLDIGDVFQMAKLGVKDLVGKFVELDGVGSLLAGGALLAGLNKIVSMAKRARDAVKGLAGAPATGTPATGGTVGHMTVNAGTVVVNGALTGKGGASAPKGTPIQDIFTKAQAKAKAKAEAPTSLWGRFKGGAAQLGGIAKSSAKTAGAMGAVLSGVDVLTSENKPEALAGAIGTTGGSAIGAAAGTAIGGALGSIIPGLGTAIGAQVGGVLGGMAGGYLGSVGAGSVYESVTAPKNEGVNEDFSKKFFENPAAEEKPGPFSLSAAKEKSGQEEGFGIKGGVDSLYASAGQRKDSERTKNPNYDFGYKQPTDLRDTNAKAFDATQYGAVDLTQAIPSLFAGLWTGAGLQGQAAIAGNSALGGSLLAPFANFGAATDMQTQASLAGSGALGANLMGTQGGELAGGNPFTPYIEGAEEAKNNVCEKFSAMGEALGTNLAQISEQGSQRFTELQTWAGERLNDLSTNASDACTQIGTYFESAKGRVEAAWSGVTGFFAGLWEEIKAGASSAASWISSKLSSAASAISAGASKAYSFFTGGGKSPAGATGFSYFRPTAYATGGIVSFALSGLAHGLAQVNEHGGELIDLPEGSRVYPADKTSSIIEREAESAFGGLSAPQINLAAPTGTKSAPQVIITGNTFEVREEADIDKIAYKIMEFLSDAQDNYNYA